jgi:DNA polymerase V
VYALVDANNMYVSCERVFQPRLAGRPVVVLSSNDGACIARSNEAKALGVKMAQPWFQVRHLERTAGLIAVSANFELYNDLSARMMAIAARFAPEQMIYSIDECFLDFSGIGAERVAIGRELRAAVLRETGLPTSVGFGPTMTLAKLANHIAKTADRQPDAYGAGLAQVCDLTALESVERDRLFAATAVGDVWGVGRKISARLEDAGIRTVLDLVRVDAGALRKSFNVVLEKTLRELRGIACMGLDDAPASRKQILVSRSFGRAVTERDGIVEAVSEFASRAAEKLRQQKSAAGSLTVFFTTSPFRRHDRQHGVDVTVPLGRPSADTALLVRAAAGVVAREFRPGFNYAKAGVMLGDICGQDLPQGELALQEPGPTAAPGRDRAGLMRAMDRLNRRYGRDSVHIGSATAASSTGELRSWATRQERRSPRYTTRWAEMPIVRA